jgi:hypothetical protein
MAGLHLLLYLRGLWLHETCPHTSSLTAEYNTAVVSSCIYPCSERKNEFANHSVKYFDEIVFCTLAA